MSTLKRLLSSLHNAVFDTSPDKALAFFIRHPQEVAWSIEDQVLTAVVDSEEKAYQLDTLTVGQLAGQLVLDGFDVTGLSPEFSGMSASVLLEGTSDTRQRHGDRIYGFRDLLRSLFGGYSRELREVKHQIGEAIRQMVITQAEDEWLDLWGALYNTQRPLEMGDTEYQQLIPKEAFRLRVNSFAIEQAILDLTGLEVTIEEPWGSIFRLDESALSGTHSFYDGSHIGYHLIRPISSTPIDWTRVMPIVERNRAAGVLALDPETRISSAVDATIDGSVWFGARSMFGAFLQFFADSRLDYLVLSDEIITKNWPVMISSVITMGNSDPLLDPDPISFRRSIAVASITLSDGVPLGDINATLSRAELTQDGGDMRTSDNLNLSAIEQTAVWKPVDLITSQENPRGEVEMPSAVSAGATKWDVRGALVEAVISGGTLIGTSRSQFIGAKALTPIAVLAFKSTGTTGYKWTDDNQWGEHQWKLTEEELEALTAACWWINQYVENNMSEDLN